MVRRLIDLVDLWCDRCGVAHEARPDRAVLLAKFRDNPPAYRPAAETSELDRLGISPRLPAAALMQDLALAFPMASFHPRGL